MNKLLKIACDSTWKSSELSVYKDDYETALYYFNESIYICNRMRTDFHLTSNCLMSIGIIYFHQKNWDKAIIYLIKSDLISKQIVTNDLNESNDYLNKIANIIGEQQVRDKISSMNKEEFEAI